MKLQPVQNLITNKQSEKQYERLDTLNDDDIFHADKVFAVTNQLTAQSRDIGQGVDANAAEGKGTDEQGAGDQGIMFGYACNETDELMPAPVMFAHRILRKMAEIRKSTNEAPWLRPDCKSQVALKYDDGKMVGIENVVVSTQHSADAENDTIRSFITEEIIKPSLPAELLIIGYGIFDQSYWSVCYWWT